MQHGDRDARRARAARPCGAPAWRACATLSRGRCTEHVWFHAWFHAYFHAYFHKIHAWFHSFLLNPSVVPQPAAYFTLGSALFLEIHAKFHACGSCDVGHIFSQPIFRVIRDMLKFRKTDLGL